MAATENGDKDNNTTLDMQATLVAIEGPDGKESRKEIGCSAPFPLLEAKGLTMFEVVGFEGAEKDQIEYELRQHKRVLGQPLASNSLQKGKKIRIAGATAGGEPHLELVRSLNLIYAGTKKGKSTFGRALESRSNANLVFQRILVVEPFDTDAEVDKVPCFHSIDDAVAYAILESYRDRRKVFILDSARAPLFETSGTASDKGVINRFFLNLTRLSNSLAVNGVTMIITLNPMSNDAAQTERIDNMLSSSLASYLRIESFDSGVFAGTYSARTANHSRDAINWSMPVDKRTTDKSSATELSLRAPVLEVDLTLQENTIATTLI